MFQSYQLLDNIGADIKNKVPIRDLVQIHDLTQEYVDSLVQQIDRRNKRYWIVAELLKIYDVIPFLAS